MHILLFIILTVGLAAQDSKSPTETKDSVLLIKLHTAFNKDLLPFTRRAFKKVSETPSIKAVIIDLHTSGNDLNTFKDAVDILNRCSVPVYMFINPSNLLMQW